MSHQRSVRRERGSRASVEPALSLAEWEEAERLFRSRRDHMVPVSEPLVLVSQVQRSGGTLINSLLDGHPELHVHPFELHVGHPTKHDWPSLDLADGPEAWFQVLWEPVVTRLFEAGYSKLGGQRRLPFELVPSFVERLFRVLATERQPRTQRDVLDVYFSAFFSAWFDYQGMRHEPKKWVTGFAPRIAWSPSRSRFRADYPDGRIIACLRDPRGWYASASRFSKRYGAFEEAMPLWLRGADEIRAAKAENPESVFVLTYEALVEDPPTVMKRVAEWLDLTWDPVLLEPTFNRLPVVANSSFGMREPGVTRESKERWRTELSADVLGRPEMQAAVARHREVRQVVDIG